MRKPTVENHQKVIKRYDTYVHQKAAEAVDQFAMLNRRQRRAWASAARRKARKA